MKIQIETDSISAYEVRQLVKLLCATVCGVASQLEDLDTEGEKRPVDMPTDEIRGRVEMLNAELFKRSTRTAKIEPEDNPAAGGDPEPSLQNTPPGTDLAAAFRAAQDADASAVDAFAKASETPSDAAYRLQKDMVAAKEDAAMMAQGSAVPLDKSGLPWDARIHAASRAVNQGDGLWRQRRGVDPALVTTVTAELRQAMSVGVPAVSATVTGGPAINGVSGVMPDTSDTHGSPDLDADAAKLKAMGGDAGPTAGDIESAGGVTGQLTRQITPPPPPRKSTAAVPPPPAQAVDTGEIDTFPRLLKFITEQKLAGKLNQIHVNQALIAIGIEGPLPVLQARPDLIPVMVGKLRAVGGV